MLFLVSRRRADDPHDPPCRGAFRVLGSGPPTWGVVLDDWPALLRLMAETGCPVIIHYGAFGDGATGRPTPTDVPRLTICDDGAPE